MRPTSSTRESTYCFCSLFEKRPPGALGVVGLMILSSVEEFSVLSLDVIVNDGFYNLRCNIPRNNGIMNLEVLSEAQQHFKKVTRWIFYLLRNQWYSSVRQTSANQRKNNLVNPYLTLQELMSTIKTTQKCHFYKHLCILWFYTAKPVTLKYIRGFLYFRGTFVSKIVILQK